MSCWITYRRDRVKYVKNLGWLVRNWKKIQHMTVEVEPSRPTSREVRLTATCRWGHSSDRYGEEVVYTCIFADITVLHGHFLDRPIFRGLWVKWLGKSMQIGTEEYKAMKVSEQLTAAIAERNAH
jgi:hypothetical protein